MTMINEKTSVEKQSVKTPIADEEANLKREKFEK